MVQRRMVTEQDREEISRGIVAGLKGKVNRGADRP